MAAGRVAKNLPMPLTEFYSGSWGDASVEDKLERLRYEVKRLSCSAPRLPKDVGYILNMSPDCWI